MARLFIVSMMVVVAAAMMVSASDLPDTLLETAITHSAGWEPVPRTRLEKLQLTQTPRIPVFLGARNQQVLFFGDDARGGPTDTAGNQRENKGRKREPVADHFNENHGLPAPKASKPSPSPPRAPRSGCEKEPCGGPESLPPEHVPPPPAPPRPEPPKVPKEPKHQDFPQPPPPQHPLPTPPSPSCGELCNPDASDPVLARVPPPPLGDEAIAAVGLEGGVLAVVMKKLRNREGWLRAQKEWLGKATEAAATVRREIELAEFTKDAVASDLEQLKIAQDALSIKYRADKLKWAFKDKKITREELHKRFEALEHAKADVAHQIREAKDEVTILENTLGPPSQQVQISPKELEDPLDFLKDVEVEERF